MEKIDFKFNGNGFIYKIMGEASTMSRPKIG